MWTDFALCIQLTPFKTIWLNFIIVYLIYCSQQHIAWFCIVYPIDSFQDHLTKFYQCVPNWLLSRPYNLIFTLTQFLHCIPTFINVYPLDSFQDHTILILAFCTQMTPPRPFDLILSMGTQLTPFKTIWTDFNIVYPIYSIDSFQDHLTWFLHFVLNWLSRLYDLSFVLCT